MKSKVLCAFKKIKHIKKPYGFIQPYFQHTTYNLYQKVMDNKIKEEPYLIVEGELADEIEDILFKANTPKEKREAF